ncbi:hypothetical protein PCE1_001500 [Barthelona sp. PCE]
MFPSNGFSQHKFLVRLNHRPKKHTSFKRLNIEDAVQSRQENVSNSENLTFFSPRPTSPPVIENRKMKYPTKAPIFDETVAFAQPVEHESDDDLQEDDLQNEIPEIITTYIETPRTPRAPPNRFSGLSATVPRDVEEDSFRTRLDDDTFNGMLRMSRGFYPQPKLQTRHHGFTDRTTGRPQTAPVTPQKELNKPLIPVLLNPNLRERQDLKMAHTVTLPVRKNASLALEQTSSAFRSMRKHITKQREKLRAEQKREEVFRRKSQRPSTADSRKKKTKSGIANSNFLQPKVLSGRALMKKKSTHTPLPVRSMTLNQHRLLKNTTIGARANINRSSRFSTTVRNAVFRDITDLCTTQPSIFVTVCNRILSFKKSRQYVHCFESNNGINALVGAIRMCLKTAKTHFFVEFDTQYILPFYMLMRVFLLMIRNSDTVLSTAKNVNVISLFLMVFPSNLIGRVHGNITVLSEIYAKLFALLHTYVSIDTDFRDLFVLSNGVTLIASYVPKIDISIPHRSLVKQMAVLRQYISPALSLLVDTLPYAAGHFSLDAFPSLLSCKEYFEYIEASEEANAAPVLDVVRLALSQYCLLNSTFYSALGLEFVSSVLNVASSTLDNDAMHVTAPEGAEEIISATFKTQDVERAAVLNRASITLETVANCIHTMCEDPTVAEKQFIEANQQTLFGFLESVANIFGEDMVSVQLHRAEAVTEHQLQSVALSVLRIIVLMTLYIDPLLNTDVLHRLHVFALSITHITFISSIITTIVMESMIDREVQNSTMCCLEMIIYFFVDFVSNADERMDEVALAPPSILEIMNSFGPVLPLISAISAIAIGNPEAKELMLESSVIDRLLLLARWEDESVKIEAITSILIICYEYPPAVSYFRKIGRLFTETFIREYPGEFLGTQLLCMLEGAPFTYTNKE